MRDFLAKFTRKTGVLAFNSSTRVLERSETEAIAVAATENRFPQTFEALLNLFNKIRMVQDLPGTKNFEDAKSWDTLKNVLKKLTFALVRAHVLEQKGADFSQTERLKFEAFCERVENLLLLEDHASHNAVYSFCSKLTTFLNKATAIDGMAFSHYCEAAYQLHKRPALEPLFKSLTIFLTAFGYSQHGLLFSQQSNSMQDDEYQVLTELLIALPQLRPTLEGMISQPAGSDLVQVMRWLDEPSQAEHCIQRKACLMFYCTVVIYSSLEYLAPLKELATSLLAKYTASENPLNLISRFECLRWIPEPMLGNTVPSILFIDSKYYTPTREDLAACQNDAARELLATEHQQRFQTHVTQIFRTHPSPLRQRVLKTLSAIERKIRERFTLEEMDPRAINTQIEELSRSTGSLLFGIVALEPGATAQEDAVPLETDTNTTSGTSSATEPHTVPELEAERSPTHTKSSNHYHTAHMLRPQPTALKKANSSSPAAAADLPAAAATP